MEDIWRDLLTLPSDPLDAGAGPGAGGSLPPSSRLPHLEFLSSPPTDSNSSAQSDGAGDHTIYKTPNPAVSLETALKIGTCSKKRGSSSGCDIDGADRKRKRLMKNRESAVRSRARRQAYTYHLEAKISLLKEENADLIKQQRKILEPGKPCKLQRTLTAPF